MNIAQSITPTRGYVLGEVLSEERKTASGLYIATTLKKGIPPKRIRVTALGAPTHDKKWIGKDHETDGAEVNRFRLKSKNGQPIEKPWHFQEGDTIYIKPHVGIKATINGKEMMFVRRGDIIGIEDGS